MQTLIPRTIHSESHPEVKNLFWFVFIATRGGLRRARIISTLKNRPSNKNQLSVDLGLDYKGVEHHVKVLEESNLVTKLGGKYGATYYVSPLFEQNYGVFEEIAAKLTDLK